MRRGVARLVGPAVAGQVEEHDLEATLGEIGGQAPAELVVEQQAVEEHEDPGSLAVALVVQAQPLDLEGALFEGTPLEEPAHPGDRRHGSRGPVATEPPSPGSAPASGPSSSSPSPARARPGSERVRRSRRSRSAEPGPHGRHARDVTRGDIRARTSVSSVRHSGSPGACPGRCARLSCSPSSREHAGHWPQPLRAWSCWAAWSWTAGEAAEGRPGYPRPCQVPG